MKKLIYLSFLSVLFYACNSEVSNKQSDVNETFLKNSETMQALFESFAAEAVDYSRFSDEVVFKGTLLNSPDSLNLDQVKEIHKGFFAKYDVKHLGEFNYLQGVNPDTGDADGSVRMYYNMEVTNSSNEKSVVIPIYESFDFDSEGKAIYVQWYSDWTASLESIE